VAKPSTVRQNLNSQGEKDWVRFLSASKNMQRRICFHESHLRTACENSIKKNKRHSFKHSRFRAPQAGGLYCTLSNEGASLLQVIQTMIIGVWLSMRVGTPILPCCVAHRDSFSRGFCCVASYTVVVLHCELLPGHLRLNIHSGTHRRRCSAQSCSA